MKNGSEKEARTRNSGSRWSREYAVYACADGVDMALKRGIFKRLKQEDRSPLRSLNFVFGGVQPPQQTFPANGISYEASNEGGPSLRLFISETEFDRKLSQITRAKDNARTFVSPATVRKIVEGAFQYASLQSAVLNEGLEKLGEC